MRADAVGPGTASAVAAHPRWSDHRTRARRAAAMLRGLPPLRHLRPMQDWSPPCLLEPLAPGPQPPGRNGPPCPPPPAVPGPTLARAHRGAGPHRGPAGCWRPHLPGGGHDRHGSRRHGAGLRASGSGCAAVEAADGARPARPVCLPGTGTAAPPAGGDGRPCRSSDGRSPLAQVPSARPRPLVVIARELGPGRARLSVVHAAGRIAPPALRDCRAILGGQAVLRWVRDIHPHLVLDVVALGRRLNRGGFDTLGLGGMVAALDALDRGTGASWPVWVNSSAGVDSPLNPQ